MKSNIAKNKLHLLRYLLFLPFLLLTFCEENSETALLDNEAVITKNSNVASLMKSAVKSDDENDDDTQCVEYVYPIGFYVLFPDSQSIETIIVNSDEELFDFFDTLTSTDEIRIDFPLVLVDVDGEETILNNLTELEETLQIAVDACRGNDEYEYCDDNNKKVYICHNGNTLCVSINAIKAHLDHGDELGQCEDN